MTAPTARGPACEVGVRSCTRSAGKPRHPRYHIPQRKRTRQGLRDAREMAVTGSMNGTLTANKACTTPRSEYLGKKFLIAAGHVLKNSQDTAPEEFMSSQSRSVFKTNASWSMAGISLGSAKTKSFFNQQRGSQFARSLRRVRARAHI